MKLSVWNSYWKFTAFILLFGILATLGWLQYRWIGELSERERERSERNLNLAAENLTREFDREITRAFFQLQVSPLTFSRKAFGDYAARYERWRQTALYPKLIGKIYVVRINDEGVIQLSNYNDSTQHFEEAEWSSPLAAWRARLEESLKIQKTNAALSKLSLADEAANKALFIPMTTVDLKKLDLKTSAPIQTAAGTENSARQVLRQAGYTIILLDADYLKNDLLPSLIKRYFNPGSDADGYDIIVRNRQTPAQIIYQTNRESFANDNKGTVRRDFFGVRLDEIESLISAAARPAIDQNAKNTSNSSPVNSPENKSVAVSRIVIPGGVNFSAENNTPVAASTAGDLEPRWQIFVQPQINTLEITAEKVRRRNLIISAGILLLLGINGVLLITLSNWAFNFARRQRNFVASASHELRTPLAVIRSLSENLADGIVKDDAQTQQYGKLINDEERRLSVMVEQMLGFAASEKKSGGQLLRKPQNIEKIIDAALEDHRPELQKANFEIEKNIEFRLPQISGDDDALRRAFGNLISNAVKYSGERRHLSITARAIRRRQSAAIEIIFADQGTGISAKDLSRVFKLFYRGQAATDEQIKGSGIGLNLVKQIIEAHGGAISVHSQLHHGSVFTLTLPAPVVDE